MEKTIYLAGGCFWGLQKVMKEICGVTDTVCGYANGTGEAEADYETVCSGKTGFRETVQVNYDPKKVSLEKLLFAFFYVIDPEAVGRQGNDVGTQYQSGIYWEPEDHEAQRSVHAAAETMRRRYPDFAVELKPLENFFAAEEYHQDYLDKNPGGYCHISPARMEAVRNMVVDPALYERPVQAQLREKLTEEQYYVTQENGTEPPFRNPFWNHDEKGIYVDAATGEPLFSSLDKFESACGWPAFSKPLDPAAVYGRTDRTFGMVRTEVRSRMGDSHLGHVFTGEPESPNGVRYCINSAALRFIPFEEMEKAGYGSLMKIFDRK